MSPTPEELLEELLAKARSHQITPEEKARQRLSFAYGNAAISNPNITRESIKRAAQRIDGKSATHAD